MISGMCKIGFGEGDFGLTLPNGYQWRGCLSMARFDREEFKVIAAKWKTEFDAEEKYFGTIELDEEFRIRFPMLDSIEEIPGKTSVLWGRTDDLKRCTAVSLPFGPHGQTSGRGGERNFTMHGTILRLMIGRSYIADPAAPFVSEIRFVPRPNSCLHSLQAHELILPKQDIESITFSEKCTTRKKTFATAYAAFFEPERGPVLDVEFKSGEIRLSAGLHSSSSHGADRHSFQSDLSFTIRFKSPRELDSALDETNELCVFLSLLAHQYIYPAEFSISVVGEEHPFQLLCRDYRIPVERTNTWIGHTLIVPDMATEDFCRALARWYTTNDEALRSRYLYRYSLEEPNMFSTERFLAIFQAVEGRISKSNNQFLSKGEFEIAEMALRKALPDAPKLSALIGKLRSNNSESLPVVLKNELPKLFDASGIRPRFDVSDFIGRIYLRRNRSSHGGARLTHEPTQSLLTDTLLLNAIYLMIECPDLGIEPREAVQKFNNAMHIDLPLGPAL